MALQEARIPGTRNGRSSSLWEASAIELRALTERVAD